MEVQPRGTGKQVFPADKASERKPVKKRKSKRLAEIRDTRFKSYMF
jgi:hypothetical protein